MALLVDKSEAMAGSYNVKIVLEDVRTDSTTTTYSLTVEIEAAGFGGLGSNRESEEWSPPPDFGIQEIDKKGIVRIFFTKLMEVPASASKIDDSVFEITVNAIDPERQPDLAFTWETTEFNAEFCLIKLTF